MSNPDIVFACPHCSAPLIVDAAAAGVTLACQKCGRPTEVPQNAESVAGKIDDLKRQLKENESQRTEVTSYIHQLNIQVQRWQLRLQTLDERKRKLEAGLEERAKPAGK